MSQRVVVVGAGMVGHRFAEELVRRDPGGRFDVHLVGAEPYAPYNRILLSDVLAGRCDLAALAMPEPERVTTHLASTAIALDLDGSAVELRHGGRLCFDRVVLATGARAFVPPLPGLADGLPRHAHVLRSLDDCRDVAARALNARHAVVLGGGLLGLEAACALVRRGVRVTLVHAGPHLAQTQLDAAPADVLARSLDGLGVDLRIGSGIEEVRTDRGTVAEVVLTGGAVLPTDLLLVSCGVRPRDDLARAAGLPCDNGVVVGDDLTSPADARVHAVGDCAAPPEGGTGLLAPGWRQAARLAGLLADGVVSTSSTNGGGVGATSSTNGGGVGATSSTNGGGSTEQSAPVRLKAAGVDLVTMGRRGTDSLDGDRVLTLHDPGGPRHVELVVAGDRLAGATCVGAPELGTALALAYDRGTALPADPMSLLLPDRAEADGSPALMPAATPVCPCNGVAKRDVVAAWEAGARSVPEVATATRATTGCGGCRQLVCGLVDWLRASDPDTSQSADVDGEQTVPGPQRATSPSEISAS